MILTPQNNRLYDSRNFEQYKNFYAIQYDVEKYRIMKDKNHADSFTVYTEYWNTELILSVDTNQETSESIYKIIYGHFYNDQNFFLFKKVHDGKIVGYKINKCRRGELWHNKLNQLYISNYFKDVQKTAIMLNMQANTDIGTETMNPALTYIEYDKDNERLTFMTVWKDNYDNEKLEIIIENPYIIKPI